MSPALLLTALCLTAPAEKGKGRFEYDPADETVRAAIIGDEHCYDPHLAVRKGQTWVTWLEFEPGKGDRTYVGTRAGGDGDWGLKTAIPSDPGSYRNPTLTFDDSGGLWLTAEREVNEQWSVVAMRLDERGHPVLTHLEGDASAFPFTIIGPGINHRTASAPEGGIWITWQANRKGRFQVEVCRTTSSGTSDMKVLSNPSAGNAWQPDIAVLPDGDVCVTWDGVQAAAYGFDTFFVRRHERRWHEPILLGATEAFEARTRIVGDSVGNVWTSWEQGSRNWGGTYRYRMNKAKPGSMDMADDCGPLHSFRWLHIASVLDSTAVAVDPALSMPAFDQLAHRPGAPKGVEHLGGYYEGGELAVDGLDRLWIVYRHYFMPWVGVDRITHMQEDWGLYARCFDGKSWSKLFRFDIGQGDGMQRLSVAPLADGVAIVYTTGRTDRRPASAVRGIASAAIHLPGSRNETELRGTPAAPVRRQVDAPASALASQPVEQVFFGDLHRHTDLSLCQVPTDGTMDDNYRYAIDVARLDFLGITDHSRDIAEGDAKSLLYWRCRKEVSRHDLGPRFIPMYAYEHSRGGEDHNVVSLHPVLFPDTMPFPELWGRLDKDTFTIPHQTQCKPIPTDGTIPLSLDDKTWSYGDNEHRRLFEIYQGCRDRVVDRDAHAAFSKGHIMGFIASSDHLSTSGSYAGVWASERTRESIFRAMQARRTFGATDRIRVKMTMRGHWMGEQVAAGEVGTIRVEAAGTSPIQSIDLIVDGRVQQSVPQTDRQVALDITPPDLSGGVHYFYARLRQADGNQAWASPIWVSGPGK